MRTMSTQPDGSLSYDDFIMQMDANIRHRKDLLTEDVNAALFAKLATCLDYAGESLYTTMKRSDFDDSGTILREDLLRILKRIGLSNVEPHLPTLLETGGANIDDERIDIINFADKLTAEVEKR